MNTYARRPNCKRARIDDGWFKQYLFDSPPSLPVPDNAKPVVSRKLRRSTRRRTPSRKADAENRDARIRQWVRVAPDSDAQPSFYVKRFERERNGLPYTKIGKTERPGRYRTSEHENNPLWAGLRTIARFTPGGGAEDMADRVKELEDVEKYVKGHVERLVNANQTSVMTYQGHGEKEVVDRRNEAEMMTRALKRMNIKMSWEQVLDA